MGWIFDGVDGEFNPISVRVNSARVVENVASDPGPPPALSDSKAKKAGGRLILITNPNCSQQDDWIASLVDEFDFDCSVFYKAVWSIQKVGFDVG